MTDGVRMGKDPHTSSTSCANAITVAQGHCKSALQKQQCLHIRTVSIKRAAINTH